jgi:hypothetical protein
MVADQVPGIGCQGVQGCQREVPGAPHNHAGVDQLDEGRIVEQIDLVEHPRSGVGWFVFAGLVEQGHAA